MEVDKDPELVESVVYKRINKFLSKKAEPTFSEKVGNYFKYFYAEYIRPNLYTIIFIMLAVVFLYYRYQYAQKEKQKAKQKKKKKEKVQRQQEIIQRMLGMFQKQQKELQKLRYENQRCFNYSKKKDTSFTPYYDDSDRWPNPNFVRHSKSKRSKNMLPHPSLNPSDIPTVSVGNNMFASYTKPDMPMDFSQIEIPIKHGKFRSDELTVDLDDFAN